LLSFRSTLMTFDDVRYVVFCVAFYAAYTICRPPLVAGHLQQHCSATLSVLPRPRLLFMIAIIRINFLQLRVIDGGTHKGVTSRGITHRIVEPPRGSSSDVQFATSKVKRLRARAL